MPSTKVKLINEIDYSKELVAEKIDIDQTSIDLGVHLFKTTAKNLESNNKNEKAIVSNMYTRWQFSVFQSTSVSCVAKYLRNFFEPIYDEEEINKLVEKILEKNKEANKDQVINFVKESEFAMAIWGYLVKDWNIVVTEEEVDKFLDDYYKATNNSIREFKVEGEKRNKIKNDIELRKVIDAINDRFIVKLKINLTKRS